VESHGSREKPRIGFLPLGKNLKVNFTGFAIADPLDSQVAKAKGIFGNPWHIFTTGFLFYVVRKSASQRKQ